MPLDEILAAIGASDLPLQGKLDALRTEFETKLAPPAIVEALHRSIDDLVASGAAERTLKAGGAAPSFVLRDTDGTAVSSADLLAHGPLVVSFYRGIWCPYCNFELQALEAVRSEIEAHGASLIALSPQTTPNSRKSRDRNTLGFPILSDPGNAVAAQFGVRWTTPEYLRDIHRQLGADLVQFSGDESWTMPMPARFVIGQDATIVHAEVNPDYTRRPDPSDLLPILDALGTRHAA